MPHDERRTSADWLELVREKVQSLRFGGVQIVVHDSKVTQIERTEKTRLQSVKNNLEMQPFYRPDRWRITQGGIALAGLPEVLFKRGNYQDKEKQMLVKKSSLVRIGITLPLLLLVIQPLRAQTSGNSESERLQKLERAVEQLQKRNAALEREVSSLKKQSTSEPGATGKRKTVVTYDGKSYVEKSVAVEEKPQIYVTPRASEFKLVLGGYIQMNLEDGEASAFEGRFGKTALKDRFRLRRARINLTGDFAENFDFKVEGEFENSDGISSNRTDFSGTDIYVNWHQFPEANIKVGQWKAPFGLEQLTPDPTLIIIE